LEIALSSFLFQNIKIYINLDDSVKSYMLSSHLIEIICTYFYMNLNMNKLTKFWFK
jgi:hypothetical protein